MLSPVEANRLAALMVEQTSDVPEEKVEEAPVEEVAPEATEVVNE